MRIIAGKYKKSNLLPVPGDRTRPTSDYLKEQIFSVIYNCENLKVLDLFAGSGSLGLEALSRGAAEAVFVDISEKAVKTINLNVSKLRCQDSSRIYKKKASAYLKTCSEKFDLIFLDPPYNGNLVNATIDLIFELDLIIKNGGVVIEHSFREIIDPKWNFYLEYEKKSGDSMVTILNARNLETEEINADI
ncbi:MAG: 16S rRNA (guanine(966)-N(2))-methyltransferase RsmD [Candidatus Cloacimonetes bacterium]|nr:16S rRNA (guanine(966)-N(2))-methyltransferase RsmD [Candidatus Cloacimonadota bacterium]